MVYSIGVGIISLIFGLMVTGQYRAKHRLHQLVWSIALYMSAAGSFSYALSMTTHSAMFFRSYYIFGALLTATWLGLGSLTLALSPSVGKALTWAVVVLSVIGAAMYLVAPVDPAKLAALNGNAGLTVLTLNGADIAMIAIMNIIGTVGLVGVAAYSAVKALRREAPWMFVWGNVLIAVGGFTMAGAGGAARLGNGAGFWGLMLLGWIFAFLGFLIMAKPNVLPVGKQAQIHA